MVGPASVPPAAMGIKGARLGKAEMRGWSEGRMGRVMLLLMLLLPLDLSAMEVIAGRVQEVLGGDSFRIGNRLIRLRDLEVWDRGQSCPDSEGKPFPCGEESVLFLKSLVEGKRLTCQLKHRDKQRRWIALCRVDGLDVGAQMVRMGHAVPAWSRGRYRKEKNQARRHMAGGWRGLPEYGPKRPSQWRRQQRKLGL
ncbi:MAG: thermonuclease family protein [Magnetococcales bacterium]|nr:thermonuclease family protein [Magnetococcales bacterium]